MRRLLLLTGNEEVLQDVHWVGLQLVFLSLPLRLQHTLRHLRRDWDGWHSSLGFLGVRRLVVLLVSYGAGRL